MKIFFSISYVFLVVSMLLGILSPIKAMEKALSNQEKIEALKKAADILDIDYWADADEATQAFKKLALNYHPDRNPMGEEKFKKIKAAQDVFKAYCQSVIFDKEEIATIQEKRQKKLESKELEKKMKELRDAALAKQPFEERHPLQERFQADETEYSKKVDEIRQNGCQYGQNDWRLEQEGSDDEVKVYTLAYYSGGPQIYTLYYNCHENVHLKEQRQRRDEYQRSTLLGQLNAGISYLAQGLNVQKVTTQEEDDLHKAPLVGQEKNYAEDLKDLFLEKETDEDLYSSDQSTFVETNEVNQQSLIKTLEDFKDRTVLPAYSSLCNGAKHFWSNLKK